MTYGAAMQSVLAPTGTGRANIALGFAGSSYRSSTGHYFGATVGRYANRIAGGRSPRRSRLRAVAKRGRELPSRRGARLRRQVWEVVEASAGLSSSPYEPRRRDGFPGNSRRASSTASTPGSFASITSDHPAPTVVNLTNHTCWNLAGEGRARSTIICSGSLHRRSRRSTTRSSRPARSPPSAARARLP